MSIRLLSAHHQLQGQIKNNAPDDGRLRSCHGMRTAAFFVAFLFLFFFSSQRLHHQHCAAQQSKAAHYALAVSARTCDGRGQAAPRAAACRRHFRRRRLRRMISRFAARCCRHTTAGIHNIARLYCRRHDDRLRITTAASSSRPIRSIDIARNALMPLAAITPRIPIQLLMTCRAFMIMLIYYAHERAGFHASALKLGRKHTSFSRRHCCVIAMLF